MSLTRHMLGAHGVCFLIGCVAGAGVVTLVVAAGRPQPETPTSTPPISTTEEATHPTKLREHALPQSNFGGMVREELLPSVARDAQSAGDSAALTDELAPDLLPAWNEYETSEHIAQSRRFNPSAIVLSHDELAELTLIFTASCEELAKANRELDMSTRLAIEEKRAAGMRQPTWEYGNQQPQGTVVAMTLDPDGTQQRFIVRPGENPRLDRASAWVEQASLAGESSIAEFFRKASRSRR